jgi:hypothetical protein
VTVKGVTYYGYLDANQPALDQAQVAGVRPEPQLGQHRVTVLAHSGASYPILRRRPA